MARTVGQFILERLAEWGVKRIYGYPGDGINGILGGFHAVERVRFVQTRHEELASFAACAHAKFTGEVGVCLATSGPGAVHLLNGLYDAKLDHQPVVAIIGQQARTALGADYQQEIDLDALYKDVAAEFVQTCMVPAQARHLVDRAVRVALSEPHGDGDHRPQRRPGGALRGPAARARGGVLVAGLDARRGSSRRRTRSSAPRRCSTPANAWRCWSAPARSARRTS